MLITLLPSAINANNGTVVIAARAGEGITMTVTQGDTTIVLDFGTIVARLLVDRLRGAVKEWKALCPHN